MVLAADAVRPVQPEQPAEPIAHDARPFKRPPQVDDRGNIHDHTLQAPCRMPAAGES